MKGKTARIKLALKGIEDFYSDFDDRPKRERELSRNLLEELMEKAGNEEEVSAVEFRIKKKFGEQERKIAAKRLGEHFSKEEERVQKEQMAHRLRGTAYVALGGALLVLQGKTSLGGSINILLLPAGWFLIFLGAEHIIADWKLRPIHKTLRKLKTTRMLILKS